MTQRRIQRIVEGMPASDGAGVKLLRVIGTPACEQVDPFLMLDEFHNDDPEAYVAGFPDHPHRGFETVTYMIQGLMRHQDSVGNKGLLRDGALQWMTAGRGIIHSEMPEQSDGLLWGYQLWVNLPASDKMAPPRYQDIPVEAIPLVEREGIRVKVLAGEWGGTKGAAETLWPIGYLDVALAPGRVFQDAVPDGQALLVFVYEGGFTAPAARETETPAAGEPQASVTRHQLAVFSPRGALEITAGAEGAGLLVMRGAPIGEPVARMGPFVMNTRQELIEAVEDYQAGRLAQP